MLIGELVGLPVHGTSVHAGGSVAGHRWRRACRNSFAGRTPVAVSGGRRRAARRPLCAAASSLQVSPGLPWATLLFLPHRNSSAYCRYRDACNIRLRGFGFALAYRAAEHRSHDGVLRPRAGPPRPRRTRPSSSAARSCSPSPPRSLRQRDLARTDRGRALLDSFRLRSQPLRHRCRARRDHPRRFDSDRRPRAAPVGALLEPNAMQSPRTRPHEVASPSVDLVPSHSPPGPIPPEAVPLADDGPR